MPVSTPLARTLVDQALTRAGVEVLLRQQSPVHLVECDLDEADLARLDLSGWTFERCLFKRTRLNAATLLDTKWSNCRGGFADFGSADLTDAMFQASDFNNASFRRSALASASFQSCKLTGADFTEARTLGATFTESLLVSAKLPSFSFRKMQLQQLDLSQADLRKCDFRDAILDNCSLRGANMADARFEGADLRGANLGGLRLLDASRFKGATISRSQAGQLLAELGLQVS